MRLCRLRCRLVLEKTVSPGSAKTPRQGLTLRRLPQARDRVVSQTPSGAEFSNRVLRGWVVTQVPKGLSCHTDSFRASLLTRTNAKSRTNSNTNPPEA